MWELFWAIVSVAVSFWFICAGHSKDPVVCCFSCHRYHPLSRCRACGRARRKYERATRAS